MIVVAHQAEKIWTYDRTTDHTRCYMRGQLFHGHANATALSSSPVVSASRTTRVLVLAVARRCALRTCGKKMRAPLLGLAKSIHYHSQLRRVGRTIVHPNFSARWVSTFFYNYGTTLCEPR